jgi:hypothetical protein
MFKIFMMIVLGIEGIMNSDPYGCGYAMNFISSLYHLCCNSKDENGNNVGAGKGTKCYFCSYSSIYSHCPKGSSWGTSCDY